jgi:hypothetical protein
MAALPPYHANDQTAYALLLPVQASVRELEARTRHYLARLRLAGDADRAALESATQALAAAAETLDQLVAANKPTSGARG